MVVIDEDGDIGDDNGHDTDQSSSHHILPSHLYHLYHHIQPSHLYHHIQASHLYHRMMIPDDARTTASQRNSLSGSSLHDSLFTSSSQ